MVKTDKGWKFDDGSVVRWPVKESDLEEYIESKHGKDAISTPLGDIERDKLNHEYLQRKFKQIGDNQWQIITEIAEQTG